MLSARSGFPEQSGDPGEEEGDQDPTADLEAAQGVGNQVLGPWAPFAVHWAACPVARVPGSALSNAYITGLRQLDRSCRSTHGVAPVIGGEGCPAAGGVFQAALLVAVGVKTAALVPTMMPLATMARISHIAAISG